MTYGICYGDGPDTTVEEYASLDAARAAARRMIEEGVESVDLVELEGSGPVYASDGERVAATHAPRRTLETLRGRS